MASPTTRIAAWMLIAILGGCDCAASGVDGGPTDASSDAAPRDSATRDSGADAGQIDAGQIDAGQIDAGPDAAALDTGTPDDAGPNDASGDAATDAGTPQARPTVIVIGGGSGSVSSTMHQARIGIGAPTPNGRANSATSSTRTGNP